MEIVLSKLVTVLRYDKSFNAQTWRKLGLNSQVITNEDAAEIDALEEDTANRLNAFCRAIVLKEDFGIRELMPKLKSRNPLAFSELGTFFKERFFREGDFPCKPELKWRWEEMSNFRDLLKQLCQTDGKTCIVVHGDAGLCKASAVAEQLYDDIFLAGCCPNAVGCTWINVSDRQESWFETETFIEYLYSIGKNKYQAILDTDKFCQLVLLDGFAIRHLPFLLSHPSRPPYLKLIVILRKTLSVIDSKLHNTVSVVKIDPPKNEDLCELLIKRYPGYESLPAPIISKIASFCRQRPYLFFVLMQSFGSLPEIANFFGKDLFKKRFSDSDDSARTILTLLEFKGIERQIALLLLFREYESISLNDWNFLNARFGVKIDAPVRIQLRMSKNGRYLTCNRLLLDAAKNSDDLISLAYRFYKRTLYPDGFPSNNSEAEKMKFVRYQENLLLNVGIKAISLTKSDWSIGAFLATCQYGCQQFYEALMHHYSRKVEIPSLINGIAIAAANTNAQIAGSLVTKLQQSPKLKPKSSILPSSSKETGLDSFFLDCAEKGTWSVVRTLALQAQHDMISAKSRSRAVIMAHQKKHFAVVKCLLKTGVDLFETVSDEGEGLLEYAITSGDDAFITSVTDLQQVDIWEAFNLALDHNKDDIAWQFFHNDPGFKVGNKMLEALLEVTKRAREELAIKFLESCGNIPRDVKLFYDAFELAIENNMPRLVCQFRALGEHPADINHKRNGRTLLMKAIEHWNKEIAAGLIELGCDISIKDSKGRTALHCAAYEASDEIAILLVKRGADPFELDSNGKSPFQIAVEDHHTLVWETFAKQFMNDPRFNKTVFNLLYQAPNKDERQLLLRHFDVTWKEDGTNENCLIKAAKFEEREAFLLDTIDEVFDLLLEKVSKLRKEAASSVIDCQDIHQRTALHYACVLGRTGFAEALLNVGANILQDREQKTPLSLAIEANHRETTEKLVKMLLHSSSRSFPFINCKDDQNETPLLKAVTFQNAAVVCALLQYDAKPDLPEPFEKSALAKSIQIGMNETTLTMIDRVTGTAVLGNALRLLAGEGNIALLSHVIATTGVLAITFDPQTGDSPLTLLIRKSKSFANSEAFQRYDKQLAEFVMQGYLDTVAEHCAGDGKAPLILAVENQLKSTAVELYLKSGPETKKKGLDVAATFETNSPLPLFVAGETKDSEMVRFALEALICHENFSLIDCVIDHPLASSIKWHEIAWQAVQTGRNDLAEEILKREKCDSGDFLFQICKNGQEGIIAKIPSLQRLVKMANSKTKATALILAAFHDNDKVAKELIQLGAKPDAADVYKRTALIVAAEQNATKVGSLLLSTKGCDAMKTDNYGETALTKAAGRQNVAFIRLLLTWVSPSTHFKTNVSQVLQETVKQNRTEVVREMLRFVKKFDIKAYTYLANAISNDNAEMLEILLKKVPRPFPAQSPGKETFIMTAASKGSPAVLKVLIDHRCGSVTDANVKGTALHFAVEADLLENARVLLEAGVSIDQRDQAGKTALLLAIERGNLPLVRLLKQFKANPDISDSSLPIVPPFMTAFWLEDVGILEEVLEMGSEITFVDPVAMATKLITRTRHPKFIERYVRFLKGDVNGDVKNSDNMLIVATRCRLLDHVRTLLSLKADFSMRNTSGDNALTVATENGFKEALEIFLSLGADVNAKQIWVDRERRKHFRTLLILATECNQSQVVKLLLSRTGINVDATDDLGETALVKAVRNGPDEIVQILVTDGRSDLNTRSKDGCSVFSLAVSKKRWTALDILVDACKNVPGENKANPLYTGDENGYPFFISTVLASDEGDLTTLLRLKSIDKDVVNSRKLVSGLPIGPTALIISIEKKLSPATRLLLLSAADLDYIDCYGKTALIAAANAGDYAIVRQVADKGADPFLFKPVSSDTAESTSLIAGVQAGRLDVVCYLLETMGTNNLANLASIIDKKNRYGETALHVAIRKGCIEMVELLLRNGANVEARNSGGLTPLMLACCSYKLHAGEIVALLLTCEAEVNARSLLDGQTALVTAISYFYKKQLIEETGRSKMVVTELLLPHDDPAIIAEPIKAFLNHPGLDENAKTTALMIAASLKNPRISHALASILLQIGVDVNCTGSFGVTPLMIAASMGNVDLVILLVQNGADSALVDSNGRDARQYAEDAKRDNVTILLPSSNRKLSISTQTTCSIL